jgi:glycosyltransferase involved in cell wall biosynthesis
MDNKQNNSFQPTIVILYTELAEYLICCLNELRLLNIEIHVINYPVNQEAPFKFNLESNKITFYNRKDYNTNSIITLIEQINPSLIYCAGWSDKDYLKTIKYFKYKIPALLGFDNQWEGSFKQKLSALYARAFITPYFKYAFVPGEKQKSFALNLGFKNRDIIIGAYSANTKYFESIYQSQKTEKELKFPKRFLYVGRYYEFKGINELWKAFIELHEEQPNDWELWCLGVGDIKPIEHPKIKHFGFIQPKDLATYTSQTGVFILPSRFEPWGVVVHEFATSGFPLLLSNQVGAAEKFLQEGLNGYSFEANNKDQLKLAMSNIIAKSNEELIKMGAISNTLSKEISPKTWANNVLNMLNSK